MRIIIEILFPGGEAKRKRLDDTKKRIMFQNLVFQVCPVIGSRALCNTSEFKCWDGQLSLRINIEYIAREASQGALKFEIYNPNANASHSHIRSEKALIIKIYGFDGQNVKLFEECRSLEICEFSKKKTYQFLETTFTFPRHYHPSGHFYYFSLLSLYFQVDVVQTNPEELSSDTERPENSSKDDNLKKLQNLFLKKDFSDFTIKVEGKTFPAHKSILELSSPGNLY